MRHGNEPVQQPFQHRNNQNCQQKQKHRRIFANAHSMAKRGKQSRGRVERRVPGRDPGRNTRALHRKRRAQERNKKVPQTPSKQPATSPVVNPPITSPSQRKVTPSYLARQSASDSLEIGNGKPGGAQNVEGKYLLTAIAAINIRAADWLPGNLPACLAENKAAPAWLNCSQGPEGATEKFRPYRSIARRKQTAKHSKQNPRTNVAFDCRSRRTAQWMLSCHDTRTVSNLACRKCPTRGSPEK
jgi:hypothetical protein